MKTDEIITEARARIIWGEPSSSVRGFLMANGISETETNARIKEFDLERKREIRRIGLMDTCIGAALTGGALLFFWLCFWRGHHISGYIGFGRGVGWIILMGLYGIWRLIRGIFYLIRPQSEKQSISDIS